MQDAATKPASVARELKDARLFREACYVDGQWVQAKSGAMINVDNPATGEIIGATKAHRELRLQNCAYWTRQPARVKKRACLKIRIAQLS